jgi:Arc/MetJ-type ribon-helix-helix transcriptional regulator
MARITFSLPDDLEPLIEDRVKELRLPSVSNYILSLVERDLASAGILVGSPMKAVRDEAAAAAEVVGPEKTLSTLRALIEAGAETAASKSA